MAISAMRRRQGQCAFVGVKGRCDERGLLEFHHVIPFAEGGPTTVENLELRCRAHNEFEAQQQVWRVGGAGLETPDMKVLLGGNEMSGGIGAVSAGISEMVLLAVIALLVALFAFGAWKLVKLLLVAFKG
jgi:HNH endonuclease